MKILSFCVPCYNSSAYMRKCIDSLLPGGDEVEILIVDDGSTDKTAEIADEYEKTYPNIVRAIHQENGGHGAAVNAGIENATGVYFKVVDSDDWVDREAYMKILTKLREFAKMRHPVDMHLSNFVYEKLSTGHERRMLLSPLFPEDKIIGWDGMKRNIKGFSILMHSVIYRTQLLRDCGLKLPKHTFYVDNLYVYIPLVHVKTIYYMNVEFYRYYIGREGQSVAEQTMIRRIDQQLRVNYMMIDAVDPWKVREPHLRRYLLSYLESVTVISTSIGYLSKDPKNYKKVEDLWDYIKKHDIRTYRHIRYGVLGGAMRIRGNFGKKMGVFFYHIAQRFIGFN
ncbi:MAG: glycosyltransferase family 2 protein [bacterium LCO1.1]|uniref:Glycosyltransferase family 2 protein n=1 Tax=Candidatus Weimeria bifida TaxID=2599074 RepID=A0A6N7J3E8_9FIRM|nr:glycosyltransferase family 2 protein [Candidatus Weimeria bifida]